MAIWETITAFAIIAGIIVGIRRLTSWSSRKGGEISDSFDQDDPVEVETLLNPGLTKPPTARRKD